MLLVKVIQFDKQACHMFSLSFSKNYKIVI